MKSLQDSIVFACGQTMKNRFMLAPLTNCQSNEDGTLTNEEIHWLSKRAEGGFGLTMTAAAHVQANGKGFDDQLGIFNDAQKDGHVKMAKAIQQHDSLAVVQLHHAGIRSPQKWITGNPVGPSSYKEARGLDLVEVEQLRDDFITAALRAKNWGYNGVQLHAAHGYVISQFLSAKYNQRKDAYGGSPENRARLLLEMVHGIRTQCGSNFLLGVRLSPERFGMDLLEVQSLCQTLIDQRQIDFLDISLWDYTKKPAERKHKEKNLLDYFTALDFKHVKLTVSGRISSAQDVKNVLATKVDFVTIGRSAILHYDFPQQVMTNQHFVSQSLPVSTDYLTKQAVGKKFIDYLSNGWQGFVQG